MTIPIEIIGMGLCTDDLTEKHKKIISKADLLVAGRRCLDDFKHNKADKLVIKKDINFIADEIQRRMTKEKIVVLASGDPLFFGIGSTLVKKIGRKNIIVHPNISSVVSAFAIIKESWHDARFISLHGKKQLCDINDLVSGKNKIAILTDPEKNPAWIARALVKFRCTDFEFYVFENLGTSEAKVFHFNDAEHVATLNFKSPNIVILKRKIILKCPKNVLGYIDNGEEKNINKEIILDIHPGMPDNLFSHEKGLITKSETRAVVLSKLKLISDSHILWDLGAGSGSVSIEASKFLHKGSVFSVEKNSARICDIKKNIEKFKVSNINIIHADLPDGIKGLPIPDRIFIGGGGKKLLQIMEQAIGKLAVNGIIVISMVLIQNIESCFNFLKDNGFTADLVQLQISRSRPMPCGYRLESLNPVWIISGEKHFHITGMV